MFDRAGDEGPTSVLIGMLQVEVGAETGAALFAWGYHPHINWRDGHLPQPVATPGIVRFDEDFTYAVSVSVASPMEWATTRDESSGWLRVAPADSQVDEALVEIATDVLLGHRDGEFAAVWLRPTVIDSLGEDDD
ncbi:hypothetical protein [Actinokineospora globicatena]|uniref:Uncharacterized protein n=1 Tax=Actinokineospora globicatena TaxID=103729 RepID=A0A9W6V7T4_9PSEU|nr:hypothetical protein [Actinokineospora globicatena]GLW90259.1 hypothetical protein Aglo03_10750 [Actinokineospora globicatena]